MENDNQILITPEAKESLTVAAKWAKFLAIMGFIGIGFMVMFAFSSLVLGKILLSRMIPNGGLVSTIYFVIFLVMAVVMFPVPLFLYRFAVHTQLAVVADDSIIMAESLGWMKKYSATMAS